MEPYYELAYALASGSLCFFVGTGFSKHLTSNQAPSWIDLLKKCTEELSCGEKIADELFPDNNPVMALEECASVINLLLSKEDKDIYQLIAKQLHELELTADADTIRIFTNKHNNIKYITTNFDLLIEDGLCGKNCTTFCNGYPVNRQTKGVHIYHIHGSIKHPRKMCVTADDYFEFINNPSYFSRKFHTILEENTTIIIGYSLGDVNLKTILSHYRYNCTHEINRQNIFYFTRKKIQQHVKDYYESTYGLRVIENTQINELFEGIDKKYEEIKDRVTKSLNKLMKVLNNEAKYTDDYLKKRDSFFEVIATIYSNGILITHPQVIKFIKDIIQRKHNFTNEYGAWEQYDHLAEWLIHLGCVMDLRETPIEETYLEAVITSLKSMSKKKELGKSWDAYHSWSNGWGSITFDNRIMIRGATQHETLHKDAKEIIERC